MLTEIIAHLQQLLEREGDIPVYILMNNNGHPLDTIDVFADPNTEQKYAFFVPYEPNEEE